MYDTETQTIAAISTPAGEGGIAVVRVSGPQAVEFCDAVFRAKSRRPLSALAGYRAAFGEVFYQGALLDEAVALVFRAPKSYTGEDVVELMCHGGETVCALLLRAVLDAGASPAAAGEFTKRAFLNSRISLTQAEAVADMIAAGSKQGVRAAAAAEKGALYQKILELKGRLLAVASHISASIDFPEEDVEEPDVDVLCAELDGVVSELNRLVDGYEGAAAVLRGVPCVIAGKANVGKSTLLNLLSGFERSIVTPIAGTTRDVIEQTVRLGDALLVLKDTAGLRETEDEVEQIGVERAQRELSCAALVLAVFDNSRELDDDDLRLISSLKNKNAIAVINKTDLESRLDEGVLRAGFPLTVSVSALDPDSVNVLDAAVKQAVGTANLDPNAPLLANERQRSAALEAVRLVASAREVLFGGSLDAAALELVDALSALATLSGENVSEAVIDDIFSRFCVGK